MSTLGCPPHAADGGTALSPPRLGEEGGGPRPPARPWGLHRASSSGGLTGGCGDGAPSPWGQPVWGLRCSCPRRELVLPLPAAPRPPRAGCSSRGAGGEAKKGSGGCAYHGADAVRGGGADGVVVGVCRCVHSAVTRSKHGGVLETRGGVLHPQQLPRGCCTLFPPPTTPRSPHQGPTTNSPDPGGTGNRGHPDIASSILMARGMAAGLDGAGGEMGIPPPIPPNPPVGSSAYLSLYAAAAAAGWAYL